MQLKILPQGRAGQPPPNSSGLPHKAKTAHDLRSMPDPNDCP